MSVETDNKVGEYGIYIDNCDHIIFKKKQIFDEKSVTSVTYRGMMLNIKLLSSDRWSVEMSHLSCKCH